MSIPRPRVDHPPLDKLRERLVAMGLPPVVSCTMIAPPWVHANYKLVFPRGSGVSDLLLRRRVSDPGHDTFTHELAALVTLRDSDLPVVKNYRILPEGTLPWPAVLSDMLPGAQGFGVIRKFPQYAPYIARTTGQIAVRLAAETRPSWGTAIDGARFVPIRDTWREEWTDRVFGWRDAARAAGTDLGPLGARLWRWVLDRIDVLDSATTWSVIHGDLHPSNLLFAKPEGDEDPPLVGVIDFESAIAGDALVEWTLLTELPEAILAHLLIGVGHDRVHAVLDDPDALARLEVYHASRAIRRLAFSAMSLFSGDGGVRRSYGMQSGHRMVQEVLERPVADKIRAALALGADGDLSGPEKGSRTERALWQGIDSFRYRPAVDVRRRAALCAASFACSLGDPRGEASAVELARRIGPQSYIVRLQPIPDRAAWFAQLLRRVVGRVDRPLAVVTVALAVAALCEFAEAPADWPVPDDTLAGLDVLVRQLHATEPPHENQTGKLIAALLVLGGLEALARHGADISEVHPGAEDALRMAWEDLTLFGEAPEGSVEPSALRDQWATAPQPDRPKIPIVVWAIEQIADPPAEPARLLGAMGLVSP